MKNIRTFKNAESKLLHTKKSLYILLGNEYLISVIIFHIDNMFTSIEN